MDQAHNNIWQTTVNIFDKPKRYSIILDRGSTDSVSQFDSYQLEKMIKPIIDAYIEKREWKFFMYVFDNTSKLELIEENLRSPLEQNDYRPFIEGVIQKYVNDLEFHKSKEDKEFINNFIKAVNICRLITC